VAYSAGLVSDSRAFFNSTLPETGLMGGISNRMKEVKRRRHRRKKVAHFQSKLKKATTSEKLAMAEKLRRLTPGCEILIRSMGLEDRKR